MLANPQDTRPRITNQFHGTMCDRRPRPQQQYTERRCWDLHRPSFIRNADRAVLTIDQAAFEIQKGQSFFDLRQFLQFCLLCTR